MLTKLEALNYRSLRYISQTLDPYQVLVGPNASGKSTFLDVISFIADMVNERTVTDAVQKRAPDFRDLTWMRQSEWLEFALEARIPESISTDYPTLRYEVHLQVAEGEIQFGVERLWLLSDKSKPHNLMPEGRLLQRPNEFPSAGRVVFVRTLRTQDLFYYSGDESFGVLNLSFGTQRSAIANLLEDEEKFSEALWFKRYVSEGVQRITLNSEVLRRPNPPQTPRRFASDGSSLATMIHELEQKYPDKLADWILHIRTALPDIASIRTVENPNDRHRYLVVKYDSGVEVPSWLVSDGTLRMLALTILAYIPNLTGVYLIEEPENGIHPRAIEPVIQSLKSVYEAQVMIATHSPVILSLSEPRELLCFSRTEQSETAVIRGDKHPNLTEWQGNISLGTLFASGVLG